MDALITILGNMPVLMRRALFIILVLLVILLIRAAVRAVSKGSGTEKSAGESAAAKLQETPILADFLRKAQSGVVKNYYFEPDGIRYNMELSIDYDKSAPNCYCGRGGILISFNARGYQTMSSAVYKQFSAQLRDAITASGMRVQPCTIRCWDTNGTGGVSKSVSHYNCYMLSSPPSPSSQSHLKSW